MDGIMTPIRYEKINTQGTHWRSGASRDQLKTVLQSCVNDGLFKQANVGGSNETEFEQAFSSLAYAYLKDKAPRLLDYIVGFQLVDRNEDNTKAMGVFGFQVGDQWLYAPVFFLNGDLKGHELLYLKNKDAFVPMKENWVNYLISRKPHVLGEGSSQNAFELGGLSPNIERLSMSPAGGLGKAGYDKWSHPFLPLYAAVKTGSARSLYKEASPEAKLAIDSLVAQPYQAALASVSQQLDLNKVIPTHYGLLKTAFDLSQKFVGVAEGFKKFYGADCFSRWGQQLKKNAADSANSVMPKMSVPKAPSYSKSSKSLIPEIDDRPDHPVKSGKLRMYVYEHVTVNDTPELTDSERERLVNDTVLIKDERGDGEVSKAYDTQMEMRLFNPDETHLYRVLEKPGSFSKMFVAVNPLSNNGAQDMVTAVRLEDGDNKAWINSYQGNVFADQDGDGPEWNDWFDDLSDSDSLSEGGTYIAVVPTHSSTVPFVVRESYGDGVYKVDFQNNPDYNETRIVQKPRVENGNYPGGFDPSPSPYGAILRVDAEGKAGTKLRAIGGELRVPGAAKFLQLKKPYGESGGSLLIPCGCGDGDYSDPSPIQFGNIEDIQTLFYEKTARLKIYDGGSDVSISSPLGTKWLSKKSAFINLIKTHGFSEKAAKDMLQHAEVKRAAVYRVQYAPGFGDKTHLVKAAFSTLQPGPGAPAASLPPEMGMEALGGRNAVLTQAPQESHELVPELMAGNTDPNVWDPWQNYTAEDFQNTMSTAQQAAQEGQKEVFDTSMIGGLLKAVRQDSLVDRYLGDLMKALNSLGRILFLFYWHQEEFEDRYGKSDMPELEDSLRNSFEALGDITLFLKEKTIESPFEGSAELNLEESARN